MSTAPYVAIATALDRVHAWWDSKREEWAVTKLLVDEVAAGWIPEPEMVGLPLEVAGPRPVDVDGCTACAGQGEVEQLDPVLRAWVRVTCQRCDGTGERDAA